MSAREVPVGTHREARERFLADTRARGVHPLDAAPPLFRFAWACGIELPPPVLMRPLSRALLFALGAGVPFAAISAFLMELQLQPPELAIGSALIFGPLFAWMMSRHYNRQLHSLELPSWEEYMGRGTRAAE